MPMSIPTIPATIGEMRAQSNAELIKLFWYCEGMVTALTSLDKVLPNGAVKLDNRQAQTMWMKRKDLIAAEIDRRMVLAEESSEEAMDRFEMNQTFAREDR